MSHFIEKIIAQLPPAAAAEFDSGAQRALLKAMSQCNLDEYPKVIGDQHGERASGDSVCLRCALPYYAHPYDWRVIGYGNIPFLNVLCDGRRVKL